VQPKLFVSLIALALFAPAWLGCAPRNVPMAEYQGFVKPLPNTQEYAPLLARGQTVGMRSGLVTLKPGESVGWHSTDEYEELIICLAGSGEIASEGHPDMPISANHYGYNPPHSRHNVTNTGPEPLRYIYVVAPAVTPVPPKPDHHSSN
jgi:quercetin dioxygenase-like cupin family protein